MNWSLQELESCPESVKELIYEIAKDEADAREQARREAGLTR